MLLLLQTRGAVRDTSKLAAAAFWYKAYVAAVAAGAEQAREIALLHSALALLNTTMLRALPAVWADPDISQSWRDAFDAGQLINATCLCGSNVTGLLAGTLGYSTTAAYLATNCSGEDVRMCVTQLAALHKLDSDSC